MPTSIWQTMVMVTSGLIAVLVADLPTQMVVPIIPEWLGWCNEKPTTAELNVTNGPKSVVMTMTSEQTTSHTEIMRIDDLISEEATNVSSRAAQPEDKKSCTIKAFDPRISLAYLVSGPTQILAGPFAAFLCDRVGSNVLLLFGLISTASLDILFAYGNGFVAFLLARVFSSFLIVIVEVAYLHMIGQLFVKDDIKRARFLGLYSTVLGLDYFGPTFFGVLYNLSDRAIPFITLLAISLITALVFFIFGLNCTVPKHSTSTNLDKESDEDSVSFISLIKDPYIIVVFTTIFFVYLPKAMIVPFISLWITDTFDTTAWVSGVVYFPGFLAYLISNIVAERLLSKFEERVWISGVVCLAVDGISVIALPFAPNIACFSMIFALQIGSSTMAGFTIFPMFLKIAERRYGSPKSSSIHGISVMAVALPYFVGPAIGSKLFEFIGLRFLNLGVGALHILVAPFIIMLRNIDGDKEEISEETCLVASSTSINESLSSE